MPPTWAVISFVFIQYDANLILLSIIGAASSSVGRILLTRISFLFGGKILSIKAAKNMEFLGDSIEGTSKRMFLLAFLWAISPVSSNILFIALGLSKAKLKEVISGFFLGRSFNYAFLAYTSDKVVKGVKALFIEDMFSWQKIVLQFLGLALIILYLAIDWKELIMKRRIRFDFRIIKI